jgi:2-haloacid dehalogenase
VTGRGPRAVDAVLFDLFGTLLSLRPLDEVCEGIAPGRGAELAGRWRARQLELSWLRTAMQLWVDFDQVTEEALGYVLREMGVTAEPEAVARTSLAFRDLPVLPEVPAVLQRLHEGGLRTGILTNASAATLDAVLRRTALAVDYALSVDAARRFKPHPAVYELGTKAIGLAADRVGFVTGNAWDAAGAGTFGFRVVWLRPAGAAAALPPVGAPEPIDATWAEVPGIFLGA